MGIVTPTLHRISIIYKDKVGIRGKAMVNKSGSNKIIKIRTSSREEMENFTVIMKKIIITIRDIKIEIKVIGINKKVGSSSKTDLMTNINRDNKIIKLAINSITLLF